VAILKRARGWGLRSDLLGAEVTDIIGIWKKFISITAAMIVQLLSEKIVVLLITIKEGIDCSKFV